MEIQHEIKQVEQWLVRCFRHSYFILSKATRLKHITEREVWDCEIIRDGKPFYVILKIFKPGTFDNVNTSLPPIDTARKCSLALREMPQLGIPTPTFIGYATHDRSAALVCEKIDKTAWEPHLRIEAAKYLAHLHVLRENRLSLILRQLVQRSDPKPHRIVSGIQEHSQVLDTRLPNWRSEFPKMAENVQDLVGSGIPATENLTLVHGDYFSVNILASSNGIRIIDWETFALGDPMWDLAFLIGADRNLETDEIEAVIQNYERIAPVEKERLIWHKQCWDTGWRLRDLVRQLQKK